MIWSFSAFSDMVKQFNCLFVACSDVHSIRNQCMVSYQILLFLRLTSCLAGFTLCAVALFATGPKCSVHTVKAQKTPVTPVYR